MESRPGRHSSDTRQGGSWAPRARDSPVCPRIRLAPGVGMSLWGRPGPKFPLNCVLCSTGCSWGGAAAVPPAPLVGPSCLLAAPGPQGGTLGPPRKQVQLLVLTQRGGRVGVFSPRQAGLAADAGPHTPTPTKADQLPPGLQLNVGARSPTERGHQVPWGGGSWSPPMVPTLHQPPGQSLEKAAPWGFSSGVTAACPEPLGDRQGRGWTPPQPPPRPCTVPAPPRLHTAA